MLQRRRNSNTLFRTGLLVAGIPLLILVPAIPSRAVITFEKTYGGSWFDEGHSVQQSRDGGYIIAGRTFPFSTGSADVYLIKTDSLGNALWQRTYGGRGGEFGNSVQQTFDGGYVITGYTESFGAGFFDVYLVKTDSSGDTAWTRAYGGTGMEWGYSVQQTADVGYIISGYTYHYGPGLTDVYLVKTDPFGNAVWTKKYGGAHHDDGYSVRQTTDGGYVIAGHTSSFGAGSNDAYVIKTDPLGDAMWTRTYGGTGSDYGYSVEQTSDGGYAIAGYTSSFGAGAEDFYLIKADSSGGTTWEKSYGGPSNERAVSMQQTTDGGYVIAGRTSSFGAGGDDVYLVKTDPLGGTKWTRTFGGPGRERGACVRQTSDDGFIIVGTTRYAGTYNTDVYLIKTDRNGLLQAYNPVSLKQDVIAELDTLNPQSKHVAKGIKKAKKHIEKSLESKRWLDETHLHRKHGKKVFYEEKKAVKDIRKLCKKGDFPDELCERLIGMLVEADSILARVAIDDAIAAGGKKKEIEKAEKEMAKAEKEKNKGKYDKAIDHYKKAWQHAIKATKHHKATQTERTGQPSRSKSQTNP